MLLVAWLGWALIEASLATGSDGKRTRPQFGWLVSPLADSLARISYDLPFLVRGQAEIPPVCIIYVDEGSARQLGTRVEPWNRKLHAQLVRRLKDFGARAVFFDVLFSEAGQDAAVDEDFAAAIKAHGNVFLGAVLETDEGIGAWQERTIPPIPLLRRAAAGWGLLTFRPVDSDYCVRRLYAGLETVPTASWVAARTLGAALPETVAGRASRRWINYYGRADCFPSVSYDRALEPDCPPDLFRDRIVVIGGRSTLGSLYLGKDDFRNPYGLLGAQFSKGPEVHLTVLLNLLKREWLTRLDPRLELGLALTIGVLLGGGLPWLRPHIAASVAFGTGTVLAIVAYWAFATHYVWFAWGVPALFQAPVALLWAVGSRYFLEERRRRALRDAFSHYLSPHMADRIADADFDLSLGGRMVEATVMFTDIENFMGLSEELAEPERVAKFLTNYFTQTTGHILESDGTIVKYMGDSVQAVWGAPLADPDHARKAVQAALDLQKSGRMEVLGHPLRTRIGVNTGPMLSGNLGSAQRFDYAVTGDAVNFASRLEGMNKFLGTSILISETVAAQLDGGFALRCVGEFLVVGKKVPRVIYEVLDRGSEVPAWCASFADALGAFRRGDLDAAEDGFRETIAQRRMDGPSQFYLERIAAVRKDGLTAGWSGIVELTGK